MRIRKKEWALPELSECPFFIFAPEKLKGSWQAFFERQSGQKREIHLDLGCGKCVFLSEVALANPDVSYVGIDISYDILGVGRRNIIAKFGKNPDNIAVTYFNIERLDSILSIDDNVSRIYINFCNPWPKSRGHKKRLTHPRQLEIYKKILRHGGEIWFKTDDTDLFLATKRYFDEAGLYVFYETDDLLSDSEAENHTTEHEEAFTKQGIKIKALRAKYK